MKKYLALTLMLVLLFLCSCGGEPESYCDHDFVEKISDEYLLLQGTCNSQAVYIVSCSLCGERGSATFKSEELGHDITAEKGCDKDEHWDKCSRGCVLNVSEHTVTDDGMCHYCGYIRGNCDHKLKGGLFYDENHHWNECVEGHMRYVVSHDLDANGACDCGYNEND